MTNHSATPVHFPPTTNHVIQPIGIPAEPAHLSSILACVIAHRVDHFAEAFGPFDEEPVATAFTDKPLYSTAYLQRANLILIERDAKVCRLERTILVRTPDEPWWDHAPKQHFLTILIDQSPWARQHFDPSKWEFGSSRCVSGIKDRAVAALYKATLQTVKRLTRGRR